MKYLPRSGDVLLLQKDDIVFKGQVYSVEVDLRYHPPTALTFIITVVGEWE